LSNNKKRLISLGIEGGGFELYLLDNGPFLECGSSEGMLNEDGDPINTWDKKFETLEDWWLNFTIGNGDDWIYFSLMFIDESIKEFVTSKVRNYHTLKPNLEYHKSRWLDKILNEE
jgi:hypothetical protein